MWIAITLMVGIGIGWALPSFKRDDIKVTMLTAMLEKNRRDDTLLLEERISMEQAIFEGLVEKYYDAYRLTELGRLLVIYPKGRAKK